FPLPAWRDPLKGEEFSDGRDAQEVRPGFPGGRGAAGPGDRQADRAGGPGPGGQRGHPRQLGQRWPAAPGRQWRGGRGGGRGGGGPRAAWGRRGGGGGGTGPRGGGALGARSGGAHG